MEALRGKTMPKFQVASMHQVLPNSFRATLVGRGVLERAGAVSSVPALQRSQAPAWTRRCTRYFKRGSGIRCSLKLGNLPTIGKWFTKAEEPGARAIDAVKQKTTHALRYAALVGQPTPPPSGQGARITGAYEGVMDLWWNPSIAELVVAFQAPDSVLTKVSGQSQQPECLANVRKLKLKEGEVQVAPSLTGVLDNLLNARAFKEIQAQIGDAQPRRVICTGFGVGGSVAAVAAVLLAVKYPLANVRCVTVDSPVITYGSPAFASLYRFLVAFSYHINTDALLALVDNTESFPLYGQFVKKKESSPKLRSKPFDPTAASPGNWNDKLIDKLMSDVVAVKNKNSGSLTKEATADDMSRNNAESQEEKGQMRAAAVSAADLSAEMEKELERLYAVDPTSRQVSLAWTDEPLQAPFNKLDTVEKLLLVGNRVTALAGLSAAAYKEYDGFVEATRMSELCIFVNRDGKGQGGGQCYVLWRPAVNTLIVAFRGTAGMTDTLVNMKSTLDSASFLDSIVKGAHVHRGFYDQLLDMFPGIRDAITSLRSQPGAGASVEHIITTGHSLGGALATIGGPLLAKEFPGADVSVVSFAAPRAGDADFTEAFATLVGSSMRFQYNYDMVPCVPLWFLGFKHVALQAYLRPSLARDGIDTGTELDLHADAPRDPTQCFAAVGKQVVANHNMGGRYIGSLVGYMQHLLKEENGRMGASKL